MPKTLDIKASVDELLDLKTQRAAINASMNALRKALRAAGMTPTTINECTRVVEADSQQRVDEDHGRRLYRDAYGFPEIFRDNVQSLPAIPVSAADASEAAAVE